LALQNEMFSALSYATSKGFRIHPDAFALLSGLDKDVLNVVKEIILLKGRHENAPDGSLILVDDIKNFIQPRHDEVAIEQKSRILLDPTPKINTAEGAEGYAALFRSRFEKSMRIFSQRPDSKRITKISSVKQRSSSALESKPQSRKKGQPADQESSREDKYDNENAGAATFVVAGLLMSKRSKKAAVELVIDDYSGTLSALAVSEEVKNYASTLALDQAIMMELESTSAGLLVRKVVSPDIPDHISNRSKSEAYAVLISDLHIGSRHFMEAEFKSFLGWLSSEDELAQRVRFLCIGGDLVDGTGIFPEQDKELVEIDVSRQMARVTQLLATVPKHIKIFAIPGNHDPGRRALPQPAFPVQGSGGLYSLDNCTVLGNPAFVELNGVKILMYHGQSLDDIIAAVPGLSYSNPAEAMKVLLRARHLSPIYGGRTPIAPEQEDMMVITEVPDILHSGHVHVVDVASYKGTLIVNSGAWQSQTKFQQTMGITPTPGIAILVNLSTLEPIGRDFKLTQ
jgi:DNA polymerase II small subunit